MVTSGPGSKGTTARRAVSYSRIASAPVVGVDAREVDGGPALVAAVQAEQHGGERLDRAGGGQGAGVERAQVGDPPDQVGGGLAWPRGGRCRSARRPMPGGSRSPRERAGQVVEGGRHQRVGDRRLHAGGHRAARGDDGLQLAVDLGQGVAHGHDDLAGELGPQADAAVSAAASHGVATHDQGRGRPPRRWPPGAAAGRGRATSCGSRRTISCGPLRRPRPDDHLQAHRCQPGRERPPGRSGASNDPYIHARHTVMRRTGTPFDATVPPALIAFRHGVASADPLPDGVLLWTRCTTDGARRRSRWTGG